MQPASQTAFYILGTLLGFVVGGAMGALLLRAAVAAFNKFAVPKQLGSDDVGDLSPVDPPLPLNDGTVKEIGRAHV